MSQFLSPIPGLGTNQPQPTFAQALSRSLLGLVGVQPSKTYEFYADPTPTPTPKPAPPQPFMFDFSPYMGSATTTPPQPPAQIGEILRQTFPTDATRSALAAYAENGAYNPEAINIWNTNGSTDLGLFQNNSNTFADLLKRRSAQMKQLGANTFTDVKNPRISAGVAALTRQDENWAGQQPWAQWYGWKNRGFNLNP